MAAGEVPSAAKSATGMMIKVLYLSYDGMTDPLGQSQVIPYLIGLAKKGYAIDIISFEKAEHFKKENEMIGSLLERNGITWHHLSYTKRPQVLSTVYDLSKMKALALKLCRQQNFQVVHCRSYIPSLVGVLLRRKYGLKFVFDMRGFWADERVEGGIWNLRNPLYKWTYQFFKRKEETFIRQADFVVTLTQKAKEEILTWGYGNVKIKVIPCCVDEVLFDPGSLNGDELEALRQRLNISTTDVVLVYLGAIGTWYLLDEMLQFFKLLHEKDTRVKFLFVTPEKKDYVVSKAKEMGISPSTLWVEKSDRLTVPYYLGLASLAIFFITPKFSKKASSPTKQGEYMSMGLPLICNSGIGDTDEIVEKSHCGLVIKQFSPSEFNRVIDSLEDLLEIQPAYIRQKAKDYYSLKNGIQQYVEMYQEIV